MPAHGLPVPPGYMAFWVPQLGDKVTSDISSGRLILGGGWCRL